MNIKVKYADWAAQVRMTLISKSTCEKDSSLPVHCAVLSLQIQSVFVAGGSQKQRLICFAADSRPIFSADLQDNVSIETVQGKRGHSGQ